MRLLILLIFLTSSIIKAQTVFSELNPRSIFYQLKEGNSIIVYQCHVEKAEQSLVTASGQTFTSQARNVTISEKYVLTKTAAHYNVKYYTTALNVFPNKKFSGLKISERPYWQFQLQKTGTIDEESMKVFLALENKGREAIEFDYGITKYNTNQVIFKRKKNFKQLVIETDHVISKLISYLNG